MGLRSWLKPRIQDLMMRAMNDLRPETVSLGGCMIRLVFCLRRRPELSREAFQRYWRETHGTLVRERAAAIGCLRYVQVHTGYDGVNEALRATRGGPEPFDGVAELWFEDAAALASDDSGRRAALELLEDERNFIDLERSPLWVADEHEVVPLSG
jgi:uncharacterized protein (TIGR02118 family)